MQQQLPTCRHGIFECNGSYCLECHKTNIDSLRKEVSILRQLDKAQTVVISRLERLEKILPRYDELHKEWMDRIDKLERLYNASTDIEQVLLNRVKELERFQEVTHLEFHARNKKPHKCPVCDGDGRVKLATPLKKDDVTYFSISCVPCKEKGIVWG